MQVPTLKGAAVAVFDVLRATTSITAALTAGSLRVVPCVSPEQAQARADRLRQHGVNPVLAGEQDGLKIPGFDLGNSPLEFGARVRNRVVVMSTSNGTKALAAAAPARFVIAACLNNLEAAALALVRRPERRIVILAAGEFGAWSDEDSLAAGLLIRRLLELKPGCWQAARDLDCWARLAYAFSADFNRRKLTAFLLASPHGKELIRFGFKRDVLACSRLNCTTMVGHLGKNQEIRKLQGRC